MALGDLYTKTNNTTVAEKHLKYAIAIYETKTTSKELQNAYYYLASYNTVSLNFKESNKIIVDCLSKVDTLDFNLLGNLELKLAQIETEIKVHNKEKLSDNKENTNKFKVLIVEDIDLNMILIKKMISTI